MMFKAVWGSSESHKGKVIIRPIMWIGPIQNLKPVARKYLNSMDKQQLLRNQNYKCNFCENKISIYPYSTADADHIIPICMGGKTNLNNMQLLCVGCHREKSACEMTCLGKNVRGKVFTDEVFIGKSIQFHFPCEKMTPKEIIESDMDEMCLLTYKKMDRSYDGSVINYLELLDKFKYVT